MEKENKDDYLFGVVWHFDKVPNFVRDSQQRLALAQLNLAVFPRNFLPNFPGVCKST